MECLACHAPNIDGARFCAKCGAPLPVQQGAEVDPLIGQTVGGRYRITGVLGEGGMGRVYNAEQRMGTSVRRVAVKTLLSQFAKDPQTVARFMRECGTVSELEHPNTIKVYDFGQIEGSGELYIAMELLSGKSLEESLLSGAMFPDRVLHIIAQVCGSLQEAHDKGIVHRDLKPANIYLTTRAGEDDVVKVLDFGIAKKGSKDNKTEQKLTQQGTILGTPPYMSPEQFTGKELDARSDIYSLGIVAYEMLTGRLPYEADTPWQWMSAHMSGQPFPFETSPNAANIPHAIKAGVMRALEKDPGRRPQTAREFYEDLTGGASRLSQVAPIAAGGSSGSNPNVYSPGGTAPAAPLAGASRGGQTQIGEPLFPEGAPNAPAQRTMMDAMPLVSPAQSPTTGGGQVFAPPTAAPKKGFPVMAVVAILGLVGIATGTGLYVMKARGGGGDDDKGTNIELGGTKKSGGDDKSDDDDGNKAASGGNVDVLETTAAGGTVETSEPVAGGTTAAGGPAPDLSSTLGTSTARPTNTTAPTGKPTATPGKHPGFDHCCRSLGGSAKAQCQSLSAAAKSGAMDANRARLAIAGLGKGCN